MSEDQGNKCSTEAISGLKDSASEFANSIANEFERLVITDGKVSLLPGQMVKTRDDQVENNAGGYVFAVSDETRIRRFLILGSTGGSYYCTEKEMTIDNVEALIDIINRGKADVLLKEIYEISVSGRNPKQDPLLLALALCARYRTHDATAIDAKSDPAVRAYGDYIQTMHRAAFSILNDVCRIPTHLFTFVNYCEMVAAQTNPVGLQKSTGWGRGMRRAIQNWYASKKPEQLAMHVTKYKSRGKWSHRDLFRLAHPIPDQNVSFHNGSALEVDQIYRYIVKGDLRVRKRRLPEDEQKVQQPEKKYRKEELDKEDQSEALNLIETYLALTKDTPEDEVAKSIKEVGLVREHIPTEHLNSKVVWGALLEKMPMTALIRNLGKLASIDAITEDLRSKVINQLTNEQELRRSKVHPIHILLAQSVYQDGRGDKGTLTWTPDQLIVDALEKAFYLSFINAPPTNKRICFAFDVSGSMTQRISGLHLSCRTAAAALSLISLRNERNSECVGFCDNLVELPYDADWTINKIEQHMDHMDFGATDCALPMLWAKEKNKKFDIFVVYTDCETYFGEVPPFEAMKQYREASGITDAKLIVMGMTATGFTIADPSDAGMLDIAGFDSAVPQLIHEFITGQL